MIGAGADIFGRYQEIVMAKNKTKETAASVESYMVAIKDEARRNDCEALAKLISSSCPSRGRLTPAPDNPDKPRTRKDSPHWPPAVKTGGNRMRNAGDD
jgi:hypothetical protein